MKQLEYDHRVKQKAMLLVRWNFSGGQYELYDFTEDEINIIEENR